MAMRLSTESFLCQLQARGLKKHLKRLNAPKHWMLDKLGGAFVSTNRLPSVARLLCDSAIFL